jgi:hypothetical protein
VDDDDDDDDTLEDDEAEQDEDEELSVLLLTDIAVAVSWLDVHCSLLLAPLSIVDAIASTAAFVDNLAPIALSTLLLYCRRSRLAALI